MQTLAWVVVAWLAVTALMQVWLVGRDRKPKTPLEAIVAIVECGLAAWAVVEIAT